MGPDRRERRQAITIEYQDQAGHEACNIGRHVDNAHAPFTQGGLDLVLAEFLAVFQALPLTKKL